MQVFEGMFGTSKSSYLKLENARMIVRHSSRIDETKMGARGRCIENIFIENGVGERFMFPTTNLAPARVMTQHINHEGTFADQVGQQILRMAQDYANLSTVSRHVINNDLNESAMLIRENCKSKMYEMRKMFERMFRSSGYQVESKKILERALTLNETETSDAVSLDQINEMKETLRAEGAELPDAVIESACKCMQANEDYLQAPSKKKSDKSLGKETYRDMIAKDDVQEDADTLVKPGSISILGCPLDKTVWDNFKDGQLELSSKPVMRDSNNKPATPNYTDKSAEMTAKLGNLLSLVQDDGMRKLLILVADSIDNENSLEVKQKLKRDPNFMRNAKAIAAKAVKIADAKTMNEDVAVAADTISVMGCPVSQSAWDNFKEGHLEMSSKPVMRDSNNKPATPNYANKTAEMNAKLGNMLSLVQDDGMRKLLIFVSDCLDDEAGFTVAKKMKLDPNFMRKIKSIAAKAVSISDSSMDAGISGNNAVIKEYVEWMNKFKVQNFLKEDAYRSNLVPGDYDTTDEELDQVVADFSASDFYNSEEAKDVVADRDDKVITKEEIMSALKAYLTSTLEAQTEKYIEDTDSAADEVYDSVKEEFENNGFTVSGDEFDDGEEVEEDRELSREDILLPSKNQGDSLKREVTASTVTNPDTGKEQAPNASYIDRLKTLSGQTNRGY